MKDLKTTIPAFECVLCKNTVKQFGNNPAPIYSEKEKCCDECNNRYVVPARIYNLNEEELEELKEEVIEIEEEYRKNNMTTSNVQVR